MSLKIILASGSPRRQELLKSAGFDFEVVVPNVDESVQEQLPPSELAIAIAQRKAKAVRQMVDDNAIIIGADTIVVVDEDILGKPRSDEEARAMLKRLSGRSHLVITGVCVLVNDREVCFAETTEVTFKQLSEEEIIHYVSTFKPLDKAGAYAIQEWIGLIGVTRIEGDYFNVVGLPVSRTAQVLRGITA